MADVKWIKIVTDIFDDEKILLIEQMPEPDTIIVIWFKLLCLAGKQNNSGVFMINERIPYTDEMLASVFRRPLNTVRMALKTFSEFGMVEIINGAITIPNWGKHQTLDKIEQKTAYMREYMQDYRQKQICKANSKANSNAKSKANVSSLDIDIEEDKDNIYMHEAVPSSEQQDEIFISLLLNDKSNFSVTVPYIKELKPLFPAVDIKVEFRKMALWLKDNPKRRKTKNGIRKFITNWLGNAQDRGSRTIPQETTSNNSKNINKAIDIINNRRNQAELAQSRFITELRKNKTFADAESRSTA